MRTDLSCLSLTWLLVVLLVPFVVGGCGGSGGVPGSETDEGGSVTLGPLQVGVAATAGFRTLVLNSPGSSHIAFTALFGSRIVRLQEVGYGRIAFSGGIPGNVEICVMNTDGTGFANLTQHEGTDLEPDWSPDGRKIAFCSYRDAHNKEIYTMNANGTGQIRLTNSAGDDECPAWSPDGTHIAFSSVRDGDYEIYVMNADGSAVTQLTERADSDREPAWSPDGRAIAFWSQRNGDAEIYVMGADGSGPTNLSRNSADDYWPTWSPDGKRIAFSSHRDSNTDVYAMNADGSGQVRLTSHEQTDTRPNWSPDGRRILFESFRAGAVRLFMMSASGSEENRLFGASTLFEQEPDWCPVPSVVRTLIGPNGSDGGFAPPFGAARPLVVVGLNADGLASAAALYLPETRWGSLAVSALNNIGADLAGLKVTGTDLRRIDEDMGRGVKRRQWVLTGSPATGAALVFFSGETGKVASVLTVADANLASAQELTTQAAGGQVVLQGSFTQAYSAADPQRNLVTGTAQTVALDGRTGEVVSVR
ncbi:MAG: DUF5050 domain-containing protein [Armatimonadetes bacterium]|nr:DUF5050 domain-containing protein [Armatimonadota bacterium]